MNSENNELSHNDVEINVSEENIILAPPVGLFDEAKELLNNSSPNLPNIQSCMK